MKTSMHAPVLKTLISVFGLAFAVQAKAADESFVKKAAADGLFEVKAAELAETNASNDQVKLLANKIMNDHLQTNDQLRQIAAIENVQLPGKPSSNSKLEILSKLKGEAFDKEYVKAMVDDHKDDIGDYLRESRSGKSPAAQNFASQSIPMLREHLTFAQQTLAQLNQTAGAGGEQSR